MKMQLDGHVIDGWDAFHDQSALVFGFPGFYGRNMNAWIDCFHYVRDGDGMSRFALGPEEPLVIEVLGTREFKRRVPEVFDALVDGATAVNQGNVEAGEIPSIHLLFW